LIVEGCPLSSDTHIPELPTLLRTKLHRPKVTADLVPRPRLLERLDQHRERPLTLVVAPAGFGKTTLTILQAATLPLIAVIARTLINCPVPSIRTDDPGFAQPATPGHRRLAYSGPASRESGGDLSCQG